MSSIVFAFLGSFGQILAVSLTTGFVADKKYHAVWIQPVIAAFWVIGVSGVVKGPWPCVAYIVGSTCGCFAGIFLRRRMP